MNKPLIETSTPLVAKVHPTDSTTNNNGGGGSRNNSNHISILKSNTLTSTPSSSPPQFSIHPLINPTTSIKYGGSNTSVYSSIEKLLASSKELIPVRHHYNTQSHQRRSEYKKGESVNFRILIFRALLKLFSLAHFLYIMVRGLIKMYAYELWNAIRN